MSAASMKKPAGGMAMMIQRGHHSPSTCQRRIDPLPSSSLTHAMAARTRVYPRPFARPSTSDGQGGLERANPSQRPMMMQLVMMRPTYAPSSSLTLGA